MTSNAVHKIFHQRRASLANEQRNYIQNTYRNMSHRRKTLGTALEASGIKDNIVEEEEEEEQTALMMKRSQTQESAHLRRSFSVLFESPDKDKEEMADFIEAYVVKQRESLSEAMRLREEVESPTDKLTTGERHRRQKILKQDAGQLHQLLYDFVESKGFGAFILTVIFMNTGMLVAQTWEEIMVRGGWYFSVFDNLFLGIYIMEVVLKIYVYRAKFVGGWNILDLSIVILSLVDFILPLVMTSIGGFNGTAIFRMLRIFRAVRAIRALRVLRTIRFLSNLQVIMTTCLQSIQSMGAIVGLMTLFMYMFAVIGRGLYSGVDPNRFGTLPSATFTLFQLLTLDDWFYIYSDVIDVYPGYWHILIFLLIYIVLEYFIFLNLFVAVLVDNFQLTLEAANEAKKGKKKHPDDSDDEDDIFAVSEVSDETDSTQNSQMSSRLQRQTITEYFGGSELKDREISQMRTIFQLLAALEYNHSTLKSQQQVVDLMVDTCTETNDDM
ncbi:cation channel sperm-associated protein 1 [Lingula anatina]|uniref:Cation channel sperm-associated protein 1 n=1 Tax=Lingula anatina TaxID=7574 RepID=A0A1S3HJ00_LINAN|nr:cation channel sperm-associated protein 1 [Lingula anatina]|eukprot:XP_013386088.1 cation channel sperm-associated protein 1 [Lingula anatina]